MKRQIVNSTIFVLFFALMFGLTAHQKVSGEPSSDILIPELNQEWIEGSIAHRVGISNLWVLDQDNDGKDELISCSENSAFILEYQSGQYIHKWFSDPAVLCYVITVGELNGDMTPEIVVASPNRDLTVFDGESYVKIGIFPNPDGIQVTDILVANVDSDIQNEIILINPTNAHVINGSNYAIEWSALDYGGEEVAVGNVDDDPTAEIIVNGTDAYILDAVRKVEEASYPGGFGTQFDVGDVDNDGRVEIAGVMGAYGTDKTITVFDTNPFSTKWQHGPIAGNLEIAILDSDHDGVSEVIIGADEVIGLNGTNGSELWRISNPRSGVYGLASGDLDADLTNEVFWGAGANVFGNPALSVGDWVTESIEWVSPDLNGLVSVAAADIDLDSDEEIVLITYCTRDGYGSGEIRVYDGNTRILEWSQILDDPFFKMNSLDIGQVDFDPALEIVVGGDYLGKTRIKVIDGQSHALEWTSSELGDGLPLRLLVDNMDQDEFDEIIVATRSGRVIVFDGRSGVIPWQRTGFVDIHDLAVGDPDHNGIPDLAILTNNRLEVFTPSTGSQILNRDFERGKKIAITQNAPGFASTYLIAVTRADFSSYIQAYKGSDFRMLWEREAQATEVTSIHTTDLDGDDVDEYIISGYSPEEDSGGSVLTSPSLLGIGSIAKPSYSDYRDPAAHGWIYQATASDVDQDGQVEVLMSAFTYWQIKELRYEPRQVTSAPCIGKDSCDGTIFDDFSDPNSGWPVLDDHNARLEYSNGEYLFLLKRADSWVAVRYDKPLLDMSVSVDARNGYTPLGSYGLIFGIADDWSQFLTLEITPDGNFKIWRFTNTAGWGLVSGGYSGAIKLDEATNSLKVIRHGIQFQAFANDQLLATFTDDLFSGPLYAGLIAKSHQPSLLIFFDNFNIVYNACTLRELRVQNLDFSLEPQPFLRWGVIDR